MVVQDSQGQTIPVTHRPAIAAIGAALVVALVGGLLVPMDKIGIGFSLTVFSAFLLSQWMRRHSVAAPHPAANWLWAPMLTFAFLIAWRDSAELRFLNFLMLALFAGVLAIRARPSSISKGSVADYPFRALAAGFVAIADGICLLANDVAWRVLPQNAHGKQAAGLLRGIVIATPLLLIFGGLFASADSGFEDLFTSILIDVPTLVQQTFVAIGFGWLTAGYFRRLFVSQPPAEAPPKQIADGSTLGATEVVVILGSINVLFALFVATQARYLFGGEVLRSTSGLGVAEFARRGFFELTAATALVLPTLLGLHAIADPSSIRLKRIYKGMSICLILLLSVVMASAAWKMKLYMEAFSLSTLRIYVAAALAWLAAVYVWFASTTLRERANRFAWGAVVLLGLFVAGLNILNPDRLVASWNVDHGKNVDWSYLTGLSDDASPIIEREWERIPPDARDAWNLRRQHEPDWRSANWSEIQSRG